MQLPASAVADERTSCADAGHSFVEGQSSGVPSWGLWFANGVCEDRAHKEALPSGKHGDQPRIGAALPVLPRPPRSAPCRSVSLEGGEARPAAPGPSGMYFDAGAEHHRRLPSVGDPGGTTRLQRTGREAPPQLLAMVGRSRRAKHVLEVVHQDRGLHGGMWTAVGWAGADS